MKRSIVFAIFFAFALNACAPSQEQIQATVQVSVEETQNAIPTATQTSVPTNTPEPTSTPEPSPTPIVLPDTLYQTFSGISVIHQDSFEYVMENQAPSGWETSEKYSIWVTNENQFKIHPTGNGDWTGAGFHYMGEEITPNTGVFFTFKYTGSSENFTLGFDNINSDGSLVPRGSNFHSVAMEIREQTLLVYGIQRENKINGSFKGNLSLHEGTWYDILLAFDENQNFIIKVWDPNNPQLQTTYLREWTDFPRAYYFISYISAKRTLLIDDFIVFRFDKIIQ